MTPRNTSSSWCGTALTRGSLWRIIYKKFWRGRDDLPVRCSSEIHKLLVSFSNSWHRNWNVRFLISRSDIILYTDINSSFCLGSGCRSFDCYHTNTNREVTEVTCTCPGCRSVTMVTVTPESQPLMTRSHVLVTWSDLCASRASHVIRPLRCFYWIVSRDQYYISIRLSSNQNNVLQDETIARNWTRIYRTAKWTIISKVELEDIMISLYKSQQKIEIFIVTIILLASWLC